MITHMLRTVSVCVLAAGSSRPACLVFSLSSAPVNMRISRKNSALVLVLVSSLACVEAQFFNAIRNLFAPVTNLFGGGRFVDDGTRSPQATGRDELYPSDCGRDPSQGTGKLCFPDGLLCQDRKYQSAPFSFILLSSSSFPVLMWSGVWWIVNIETGFIYARPSQPTIIHCP